MAVNCFFKGGRFHLEFLLCVKHNGMAACGTSKFRANKCNNNQVMSNKLNFKMAAAAVLKFRPVSILVT